MVNTKIHDFLKVKVPLAVSTQKKKVFETLENFKVSKVRTVLLLKYAFT